MIQIQIDWKTYHPKWTFYHFETILDWISCGEIELISEKSADPRLPTANSWQARILPLDQSIITKLREELERMWRILEEMESFTSSEYVDGRKFQLQEVRDFLTSLEEEKETEEATQQIRDVIVPELPEVPNWKAFTHDWVTRESKDYQIEKLTIWSHAITQWIHSQSKTK